MGKRIESNSKQSFESKPSVVNFTSILASISPLLTMNEDLCIQYANPSLLKEFEITNDLSGKSFLKIFSLSKTDKKSFLENLDLSKTSRVGNCEFKIKERIFGYSIFRFADEIGIILKDITETKKLQKKIFNLHSKLLKLQENERQSIARDLHDSVGQTILAAKLNLIAFEKSPIQMRERFGVGLSLIDKASQELREIYTNLYPSALRELGLSSAIKSFLNGFPNIKKYKLSLNINLKVKISEDLQIQIFRIIQEVCTNIFKHANASEISISLSEIEESIELSISDNGKGFDLEIVKMKPNGFGLENIKRRVEDMDGNLKINSGFKKGTQFAIQIPYS